MTAIQTVRQRQSLPSRREPYWALIGTGQQGLQLRHSDHGYALIDSAHKQIKDRNDMTLAEVESWLGGG